MGASEAQKRAMKRYMQKRKRVSIDLDPKVYAALYEIAASRSVSVGKYIRTIIGYEVLEYLEDDYND